MDIFKDFSPEAFKNMIDLTNLCINNKIKIGGAESITNEIEDSIKNILFEHQYLNEKLLKSS